MLQAGAQVHITPLPSFSCQVVTLRDRIAISTEPSGSSTAKTLHKPNAKNAKGFVAIAVRQRHMHATAARASCCCAA